MSSLPHDVIKHAPAAGSLTLESLPAEMLQRVCDQLMRLYRGYYDEDDDSDSDSEDPPKSRYEGLDGIISLTRTSRRLHEHAINALWHTLPGYGFLVFLLPQDAWVQQVVPARWSGTERKLFIVRPLVDADFTRFKHYARRVRRILMRMDLPQFPDRIRRAFDTSIVEHLASYLGTRTLLPNLGVLHVQPHGEQLTTFYRSLPIFFCPRIRNFHCSGHPDGDGDVAFHECERTLYKLQVAAPTLLYFSFTVNPWFSRMSTAICSTICQLHHLNAIHTDPIPISLDALRHLASLRSLRTLDVKIEEKVDDEALALFHNMSQQHFPNLRFLRLVHEVSMPILTTILCSVRSSLLTKIDMEVNDCNIPVLDIADVIHAIGTRKGRHRIQTVVIKALTVKRGETDPMLGEDTLEPLLRLKNLVELNLDLCGPFEVTDDFLITMGSCWPNIKRLELGRSMYSSEHGEKYLATFLGLVVIAHKCPKLAVLRVALDPDLKRIPGTLRRNRPGLGVEHDAMRTLKVGRSKIEDSVGVAAFLSDLFPKLIDVECDWPWEEEVEENEDLTEEEREAILAEAIYRTRWQRAVWTLLPKFVRIREQERRWARENGIAIRPRLELDM
ncbi:hypothetical protein C8Q80DRAFT_1141472 [Daedaleopsis nitida]|nr:hypothetical protein C8Q80DRAFT_1141472 [Daedaleopsis nitida]